MARVNVYLPDDLAEEMAEVEDLPTSAICQRALREELRQMQAITEAGKDMKRIEVDVEDRNGDVHTVAFTGRWLVSSDSDHGQTDEAGHDAGTRWGIALTGRGRYAVYSVGGRGTGNGHLADYDDLDAAWLDGVPRDITAFALGELTGEVPVVELDI
jgi:hypothetical protein